MLTEELVREHLKAVTAELDRLDKDRAALVNLVQNYEEFLRLRSGNGVASPSVAVATAVAPAPESAATATEPVAPLPSEIVSTRSAIKKVLLDARGAPLHNKEIATRASALGALIKKNPKYPHNSGIDFQLYRLAADGAVEKMGNGFWRAKT